MNDNSRTPKVENFIIFQETGFDETNDIETEVNFHVVNRRVNKTGNYSHGQNKKCLSRRGFKRRRSFPLIIERNRSILINVISCTISVVLLIALAINLDTPKTDLTNDQPIIEITNSTANIETTIYTEEVPLATEAVITYMNSNNTQKAVEIYKAFNGSKGALNYGLAWDFTYQAIGLPLGLELKSAELELSENESYKNAQTFELDVTEYKFSVYNLKPATKYYYRLNLTLSDGTNFGTVGEFKTAKSPRILNIEGAVNVRDIGGYKTLDGKKIKYGLLYRGSEIDGKVEKEYCLTEKGKNQMLNDLKIKFDMDLRASTLGEDGLDALGENIPHKYYSVLDYSSVLAEDCHDRIKRIFTDLSDENNYPIYLHCTYGRDRTGTICYLLEALLGVSDEDLYRDYALSAFTDSFIETEKFEAFISDIEKLPGKTTQQKVEKWLLSIGVTQGEINNIKQILLAD